MPEKCPLCRKNEFFNNQFRVKNKLYGLCKYCGLIQLNKEYLINNYEEKNRYKLHNNSITNEKYTNYLKNIIHTIIKPYLKKDDYILDFGSGPEPVLSELLKKDGYRNVYVYDKYFSDNKSAFNRNYNAITAIEVIEHVININDIISNLCRRLKKDGYLIIKTNFYNNTDFVNWWYVQDITHVTFLSHKTLKYLADFYNMNIISISESSVILKKLNSYIIA